jgi:hydroxymethylpyrimidine kinase/phosphomethylpyrimidine kinase/thiamine-phosphate diphosphorylase
MKLDKNIFKLYAVTDRHYLNGRTLSQCVEESIKSGVTIVQLREKELDKENKLNEAKQIKKVCQKYHIPFIINDDVLLAKEIDADGVHIGQDDLDIQEARKILGNDKIIGVSAHNMNEALKAQEEGADYLGVGAIFSTSTKTNTISVSIDTLSTICKNVHIPVVAIGGIDEQNMIQLTQTHISGIAVVSAIFNNDDIANATKQLRIKIDRLLKQEIPAALTIAGSDCSGGAGIQADLKTMMAHHVYGMSAITALTAQNTLGVSDIMDVTPEFLEKQLDSIFTDIYPQAVKIGMVSQKEIIDVIANKLKQYNARNIVLDPVMVATSGAKLISDEAIHYLKETLFPLATVLTPNILEAEVITNMSIQNEESMKKAAKQIGDQYHCAVLLKGGHKVEDANDLLYKDNQFYHYKGKRIDNDNTHGTGCTLSSAIASSLANGLSLQQSIQHAKEYISGALNAQLDLGSGSGPMDHAYNIKK